MPRRQPMYTVIDSAGREVGGSQVMDERLRDLADETRGSIVKSPPGTVVYESAWLTGSDLGPSPDSPQEEGS